MTSKEERSYFHQTIREVFGGQLETKMTTIPNPETGENESRIVIKWAQAGANSCNAGEVV
jgi:hypothetical protein